MSTPADRARKAATLLVWVAFFFWHWLIALMAVPTFIAVYRNHRNIMTILFFNLLLGWTPAVLLIAFFAAHGGERRSTPALDSLRRKVQGREEAEEHEDFIPI